MAAMSKTVDRDEQARRQLRRLAESMADDIFGMTDEEFLAELEATGENFDALARRGEEAIARGIAESGRRKLAAARDGYRAAAARDRGRSAGSSHVIKLPLGDKRRILERFAANDSELRAKLTLAARQGVDGEISENDLNTLLEDLRDVGAIDDEGNPT
jgi:hypothetical protein